MRFLRVIGWEDFQHYKNRRAPWIKQSTSILDQIEHPRFTKLTDGAKLTLHHVRLLAGVTGNRIPESWLTPGHLNMQTKPRVTEIVEAGFVEWFEEEEFPACDVGSPPSSVCSLASDAPNDVSAEPSANVFPRAGARARGRARSQDSLSSPSSPEGKERKARATGAREMVEEFVVTDHHREWAARTVPEIPATEIDGVTESWRDHQRTNKYRGKSGPIADVDASWRNWMRNEVKFNRGRYGIRNDQKRSAPATYAGRTE